MELAQTVRRMALVQVPVSITAAQPLSYCVIDSQIWIQDGALSGGRYSVCHSPLLQF